MIFNDKITTKVIIGNNKTIEYKIIQIWNVDTFEGGSISRASFLEKRATEFEKINQGKFFIVKNLTPEQAINKINNGELPSMISFGMGFGSKIKNYLQPIYSDYSYIRKDILKCGKIDNISFAIPYILGGYSIITDNSEYNKDIEIVTFTNQYIIPTNALITQNYIQLPLNSFEVYENYTKGKYKAILGTQRDVFRCNNRNNNGKGENKFSFETSNYSDLIQFLSIFDAKNFDLCNYFIQFLTSDSIQEKLCNINMFNVLQKEFYTDELYKKFEVTLNRELTSINTFY